MEANEANYVVMIAVFLIWSGIFFYIFALDKKVKRLERAFEADKSENKAGN